MPVAVHNVAERGRLFLAWPRGVIRRSLTGGVRLTGSALLVAIGIIHLLLAPQYYQAAAYVGILFFVTASVAWLTALGIAAGIRGARISGGLVTAGAAAALVLSSTVGLPGFVDSFSAPGAGLSLLLEGSFLVIYVALAVYRRSTFLGHSSRGVNRVPRTCRTEAQ